MQIDGLPVFNGLEPLTFFVQDIDVVNGKRKNPLECVGANALMRTCNSKDVRVYRSVTYIKVEEGTTKIKHDAPWYKGDHWVRLATSRPFYIELVCYDREGKSFVKGEYTLGKMCRTKIEGSGQQGSDKTPEQQKASDKRRREKEKAIQAIIDAGGTPPRKHEALEIREKAPTV